MITDDKRATSILKEYKSSMETPSYKCVYTKNEVLWAMEIVVYEKDDDDSEDEY